MQTAQLKSVKPTPLQIEDGIPLPPRTGPGYPRPHSIASVLGRLEVGQSTWVAKSVRAASGSLYNAKRGTTKSFASRTEAGGTRIWRTA